MSNPKQPKVRLFVRGAYDIQKLRIQCGNRVVDNFKKKLGQVAGAKEDTLDEVSQKLLEEYRATFKKISDAIVTADVDEGGEKVSDEGGLDKLTASAVKLVTHRYKVITESSKKFPTKKTFVGDPVFSDYTELCLVSQYVDLERNEAAHFRRLGEILSGVPIYDQWLEAVSGIGPAMAGVIIAEVDIEKARHVSSLWKYAGLDVAEDGRGRTRQKEHLVQREYINKDGEVELRDSVTFNPFLKTKLIGVCGPSFLRCGSPYAQIYRDVKNRYENHAKWGKQNDKVEIEVNGKKRKLTSKSKRHNMAIRYMVKMFLADLWVKWRGIEGLPVTQPYSVDKLGRFPHKGGAAGAEVKGSAEAAD